MLAGALGGPMREETQAYLSDLRSERAKWLARPIQT